MKIKKVEEKEGDGAKNVKKEEKQSKVGKKKRRKKKLQTCYFNSSPYLKYLGSYVD
jgi:hypothetical protein